MKKKKGKRKVPGPLAGPNPGAYIKQALVEQGGISSKGKRKGKGVAKPR